MSKSNATQTVQVQKKLTRKQQSRLRRDTLQKQRGQRRRVLIVVSGVLGLALLVVFYGILQQKVLVLDEPVANVNGETISARDFQARVRLERVVAQQQMFQAQAQEDHETVQMYQEELATPTTLGQQIIQRMVDELLLKQSAKDFGVSVSPEEVQTYLQPQLGSDPNSPMPAPAPTSFPTPVLPGSFQPAYVISQVNQLTALGFSEQSYRKSIEVQLLADKVRQAIATTVPTMTDQVQFRHIDVLPTDSSTVNQSIQQDGFDKVYQAVISDTYPLTTVAASKTLDWFPRDLISDSTEYGPTLANQLFDPSIPLSTTISGLNLAGKTYYFMQAYAHEVAPLNIYVLRRRQQLAINAWLDQRRNPAFLLNWADRVPPES